MNTASLFKHKTVLSFEVFPPKRTAPVDTIYRTLDELALLKPDFVSVTYGAGGYGNRGATCSIARDLLTRYHVESVAHLPGVGMTRAEVTEVLDELKAIGVENVLALRGDMHEGMVAGDFPHASDLITFIRSRYDFNLIAACYPETHPEAPDALTDIRYLKAKVDAGVSQLITQLFFDNDCFYRFRERCELAGIEVPIEAGIMPAANKRQIERMVALCGASLPPKFVSMMERYQDRAEAVVDAGIAYAVDQIVDLLTHGVAGIHLYTMNNPYIARRIHEAVHRLL